MTKRRCRTSSRPSSAKRSRRSGSKSSSARKGTAKRPGPVASAELLAMLSAVSTPIINYSALSFSPTWCGLCNKMEYVVHTPATTPGSATMPPSTGTLRFWGQMTHSVGGWARQTVDPGWWLRELSAWCSEEASRLSGATGSSSNGAVLSRTPRPGAPPTSTAAKRCGKPGTARTLSSIRCSGTGLDLPSGAG